MTGKQEVFDDPITEAEWDRIEAEQHAVNAGVAAADAVWNDAAAAAATGSWEPIAEMGAGQPPSGGMWQGAKWPDLYDEDGIWVGDGDGWIDPEADFWDDPQAPGSPE